MSRYEYTPLSDGLNNIRLLRLLPAETEDAEIRAELLEYSLAKFRKSRHSYDALSYFWGDVNPPRSVFIGDDHLNVTPNLYVALVQLRDTDFPRIIWIDAICINQTDTHEKEFQIHSMAKIYSMAKRVIVWLGEAADDSDEALAAIRTAGKGSAEPPDDWERAISPAVTSLLQRPWFVRIWEVAAARHVVIICGTTEIDGHAFSTGLRHFQPPDDVHHQISTVNSLIQEAIFRSEFESTSQGRLTLNICTLGALMSMYFTHQATQRHDKIYALLGMASDDISNAGLLPDYNVQWEEIQRRLFRFVLSENISVTTSLNGDQVEIEGKGRALGRVMSKGRNPNGSQHISIAFYENEYQWQNTSEDLVWSFQATTANNVRRNDIIYLLDGASKSIIVRPLGHVFHVICIAPTDQFEDKSFSERTPRQIPIVWNWAEFPEDPESHPSRATGKEKDLWNSALALTDTGKDKRARKFITLLIELLSLTETKDNTRALAGTEVGHSASGMREITKSEVLDLVQRLDSDIIMELLPWIPHEIRNTEKVLIAIAGRHHKEMVAQVLLEWKDDKTVVTEAVLTAAIRSYNDQTEKLQLFLDHRSDRTIITEALMAAEAGRYGCHEDTMQLLLDYKSDDVLVTEAVLSAAAGGSTSTLPVLLDRQGENFDIPEAVLVAATDIPYNLRFLLERYADKTEITEAVLAAAAGSPFGDEILEIILSLKEDIILQATVTVLCAAVGNERRGLQVLQDLYAEEGKSVEFPDGAVTQSVLEAAARNYGYTADRIMSFLLRQIKGDIHITAPVVEAAMANKEHSYQLSRTLCDWSDEAKQIYLSMGGEKATQAYKDDLEHG